MRFCLVLAVLSALTSSFVSAAGADDDWWRHAVIYEIYPRSFGDSNGDGLGDLNGITKHLDYLQELGVDAIWITPFFPSPQVDFGYDVSDYRAVDPQYGTLADFDRLVAEAQRRKIRVVTDFVVNHTSDQHAWFVESKASRTNPKADWYIWRDGKANGQPPNNWQSLFGHSAWQYVPSRKQFYYHEFYKEQPDLNWRNRQVRDAMYDVMRFWMRRGVAGFRLDAVTTLFEDPALRDEPIAKPGKNAYGEPFLNRQYTDNLPEVHDVLREMRRVTDEFPGRVLIGETYLPNATELAKMYGQHNDELQLPMDTQFGFTNQLSASALRDKLREAETGIGGNLPLFVFENHDNKRSLDRYSDGQHDAAIARLLATLLLTPRCVSMLYYGEELGMKNSDPKRREDVKDPIGRIGWPKEIGRDGERTPMQWDGTKNAGFSSATSIWLPVGASYRAVNVAAEEKDRTSLLHYYQALIRLRRENAAIRDGSFALINESDPNVLAFVRTGSNNERVLVAINCSSAAQKVRGELGGANGSERNIKTLVSSFSPAGQVRAVRSLSLPPYGSLVGQIQ